MIDRRHFLVGLDFPVGFRRAAFASQVDLLDLVGNAQLFEQPQRVRGARPRRVVELEHRSLRVLAKKP
jgi:hypothetical protein